MVIRLLAAIVRFLLLVAPTLRDGAAEWDFKVLLVGTVENVAARAASIYLRGGSSADSTG